MLGEEAAAAGVTDSVTDEHPHVVDDVDEPRADVSWLRFERRRLYSL